MGMSSRHNQHLFPLQVDEKDFMHLGYVPKYINTQTHMMDLSVIKMQKRRVLYNKKTAQLQMLSI